jgi:hypothetical protein
VEKPGQINDRAAALSVFAKLDDGVLDSLVECRGARMTYPLLRALLLETLHQGRSINEKYGVQYFNLVLMYVSEKV